MRYVCVVFCMLIGLAVMAAADQEEGLTIEQNLPPTTAVTDVALDAEVSKTDDQGLSLGTGKATVPGFSGGTAQDSGE